MGFLDTLPQNTADAGQAPYNAKVLNAVIAKQHDAIKWAHVTSTINGHTGKFAVFELPMSFEGIYLAAGAGLLQQIADVTGCMLMTARLADLIYEQSPVRILPYFDFDRNRMMTIEWFRRSTAGINNLIAKAGYTKGPLQNLGKPFILSNLIASSGKSCNYGLYVPASMSPGGVFGGVHTEATVSLPPNQVRVCQGRGTYHGLDQSDYCLAPTTRVLKSDLTWATIEALRVGDELIGFDEELVGHPKFRRSTVLAVTRLRQPCVEITTNRGVVVSSMRHRWAVRGVQTGPRATKAITRKTRWVESSAIKPGDAIPWLCNPWETENTWDGGWMAGFLDGEGWVAQNGSFGFGQNPGVLLDRAIDMFHARGMPTHTYPNKQGCIQVYVAGRKSSWKALGMFRPLRLLAKSALLWEGKWALAGGPGPEYRREHTSAEVLSVRDVGEREVIGIKTTTGTFIAEGLYSHNSEIIRLVSRNCIIDGELRDLADVVRDASLSALVSTEGPLQIVRQPGVPLVPFVGIGAGPFSDGRDGKTPADFTLTALPAADGAEEPPPAPLPPAVSPKFLQESSSATPFFIGAAVVATGIAVAVAIRRRRKRRR